MKEWVLLRGADGGRHRRGGPRRGAAAAPAQRAVRPGGAGKAPGAGEGGL